MAHKGARFRFEVVHHPSESQIVTLETEKEWISRRLKGAVDSWIENANDYGECSVTIRITRNGDRINDSTACQDVT